MDIYIEIRHKISVLSTESLSLKGSAAFPLRSPRATPLSAETSVLDS